MYVFFNFAFKFLPIFSNISNFYRLIHFYQLSLDTLDSDFTLIVPTGDAVDTRVRGQTVGMCAGVRA